jgi:hypothetical protein
MKHSLWLWARILFLFAVFTLVGLLPALSVIPVSSVPPLAEMRRSEGTLSFRPIGGRSGSLTVLKKSNGDEEAFSCRENMQGSHDCVDRRYKGGSAQIHWVWVKSPFGEGYRFPAQIIVNGEVVRDRATAIEQIENTRVTFQLLMAPLTFLGFLVGVFLIVAPKGTVTGDAVDR